MKDLDPRSLGRRPRSPFRPGAVGVAVVLCGTGAGLLAGGRRVDGWLAVSIGVGLLLAAATGLGRRPPAG